MMYHFYVDKLVIKNKLLYETTEICIPVNGITFIVGNNGCGKTTLLNHIKYSNPEQIALIAQENDLIFSELSTEDNIMLFSEDKEKLSQLLKTLNIEYILKRNSKHLSGGEKKW